jgi:hypothetical protein
LGQKEEAIRLLKKAADEHFAPVTYIMADPLFDGLRSEPGFDDILRTLNLTPPRR